MHRRPILGRLRRGRAFTLIEFIAVIVVIAILTVVAPPQFLDVRADAWNAQHARVAAGFTTAVNTARAACRAYGNPAGSTTIDFGKIDPGTIDFNTNCVPVGTTWTSGAPSTTNCTEVFNALMRGVRTADTATAGVPYYTTSGARACFYWAVDSSANAPNPSVAGTLQIMLTHSAGGTGEIKYTPWGSSTWIVLVGPN